MIAYEFIRIRYTILHVFDFDYDLLLEDYNQGIPDIENMIV